MDGLSRKEKLALWRAARQAPQQGAGGAGAGNGKEVPDGVLAARPGAGNKRAPSRVSKEGPKRKPFQASGKTPTSVRTCCCCVADALAKKYSSPLEVLCSIPSLDALNVRPGAMMCILRSRYQYNSMNRPTEVSSVPVDFQSDF